MGGAFAGAAGFAAALAVVASLPFVLDGALLTVGQVAVALAGIFAALIGLSAIIVSFREIESNASFEISKTKLRFNDIEDPAGAEAKFIEREIDLASVRSIRIDEGLLAWLCGYGNIEIFAGCGPEPAAVIPGVARPQLFKKKFELILAHRFRASHHPLCACNDRGLPRLN